MIGALPLAQRPKVRRFIREAAEDGLDLNSSAGERAIVLLLTQAPGAPDRCRSCGRDGLRVFELLNARCERCATRETSGEPGDFDKRFQLDPDGYVRRRDSALSEAVADLAERTIPARFADYDRAHWRGPWPVPDRLASWPNPSPDRSAVPWVVIFLGVVGCGKTMAATALFREALGRWGYGGAWLDWSATLDDVRRSFDAHSTCEAEAACMSGRIVLLDDLGAERSTPFAMDFASKVLRRRHREGLPTVITSNARDLGELAGAADGRVLSRLAEGEVIVLDGVDRRLHGVAA